VESADKHSNEVTAGSIRELELLSFRTNLLYATYYSGESTVAGLYWTPRFIFSPSWGGALQTGLTFFKVAGPPNTYFLAPEIQALASYLLFQNLMLEVGGGFQKWLVLDGGTNFLLSANGHYVFSNPLFGVMDTLFLGYSRMYELDVHHQIRIGMQLRFN